jgi:hypothetical protein
VVAVGHGRLEDGPRFAPLIREIIRDLVRRHPIDRERVNVAGCSNGGYMSLKTTTIYRNLFAASVPIFAVVGSFPPGGPAVITDAELRNIHTPTWLVASRDDDTVPPEPNTIHAHDLIPGSVMTCMTTSSGTATSSPVTGRGSMSPTMTRASSEPTSGSGWPNNGADRMARVRLRATFSEMASAHPGRPSGVGSSGCTATASTSQLLAGREPAVELLPAHPQVAVRQLDALRCRPLARQS